MTCSAGWNSPLFRPESGKLSKVVVWSPLSTENQRIWRLGHPLAVRHKKRTLWTRPFGALFAPKKGAGWSGDFSGDKLGGLTDHPDGPSDTEPGPRAAGREKPCGEGARELGPVLRTFAPKKASGDKAVTSGDEFSGLEFAGFSGQKTEFGARQTPGAGFRRKTSELGGSGTLSTSDTKKRTFRSSPFSALFAPKTDKSRSKLDQTLRIQSEHTTRGPCRPLNPSTKPPAHNSRTCLATLAGRTKTHPKNSGPCGLRQRIPPSLGTAIRGGTDSIPRHE